MENTKEYFCWIRTVETPAAAAEGVGPLSPEMIAGMKLSTAEAAKHLRLTCPAVTYCIEPMHKDAPAPATKSVMVGQFEQRTRSILSTSNWTAVHLEQPQKALSHTIEMWPIFGSRLDALEWIETKPGEAFSKDAKGLALMCFARISE